MAGKDSQLNEGENYPKSAISSWSGFVYQGKIALYHCLKLIDSGRNKFELQLDSTDDFAIYENQSIVSAHQVKAKVGKHLSNYTEALEKSGLIIGDKISGIQRYFHVSVEISDTSNYTCNNKETVEFYSYGNKKYCGLGEIEGLTKILIKAICTKKNITLSDNIINTNYCILSESISSQAIEIHRKNQAEGVPENKAAYTYRITAENILSQILSNNPQDDIEYFSASLRNDLYGYLELKLDQSLASMTDAQYLRSRDLFNHIQILDQEEIKDLCRIINPSEKFSKIQKIEIYRYATLIQEISHDPILEGIPHYTDKQKDFYIPTSITLVNENENEICANSIRSEIRDSELLYLLFEYNKLIASHAVKSFTVDSSITDLDEFFHKTHENNDSSITKTMNISVVTIAEAEEILNAR